MRASRASLGSRSYGVNYDRVDSIIGAGIDDDAKAVCPPLQCCDGRPQGLLRQRGGDFDANWDVVLRRIRPNLRQTVVVSAKTVDGRRPFLPLIEPTFEPNTDKDLTLLERATKKKLSMMHVFQPVGEITGSTSAAMTGARRKTKSGTTAPSTLLVCFAFA